MCSLGICLTFFSGSKLFGNFELRPNSWTKSRQKSPEFSSLLFTVISTALPWYFYFFNSRNLLCISSNSRNFFHISSNSHNLLNISTVQITLPYGLRNPYSNLKSENSQDYAQKPQRNCTFMNSASVLNNYNKIKKWAPKQVKSQLEGRRTHLRRRYKRTIAWDFRGNNIREEHI